MLLKLTAKKYSIRIRDFLKGLYMAVGTGTGLFIQNLLDTGVYTISWKMVAMSAVAAALTYIGRKFIVDDVKLAKKTLREAEDLARAKALQEEEEITKKTITENEN